LVQRELAKTQLAEDSRASEHAALAAITDADNAAANPRPKITVRKVVGSIIGGIGVLVLVGNITGLFPTIPFAGFILMVLGGIVASPPPPRRITIRK
jgi:hypothetical protein